LIAARIAGLTTDTILDSAVKSDSISVGVEASDLRCAAVFDHLRGSMKCLAIIRVIAVSTRMMTRIKAVEEAAAARAVEAAGECTGARSAGFASKKST
jgi:hypothetical protein